MLLTIACALLALVVVLTVIDRAGGSLPERMLFAAAWPAVGLVGIWRGRYVGMTWNELALGGIVVYGAVCLSTWWRPLLIMSDILPSNVRNDHRLMKRAHIATAITLVLVIVVAGYMELQS
jgi:hypothetical protein